jgi:uncharacterized RDD family membrane protein YckC
MSESRITFEESTPSPYAGFWRRTGASTIDTLIVLPIMAFLLWLFVSAGPRGRDLLDFLAGYYILTGVLLLAYRVYFETSRHQATLGKMALKIVVTDLDGHPITPKRALVRSWVYWAGSLLAIVDILFGTMTTVGGMGAFMFAGTVAITISCVMVAFTERKQGGHDFMADCLVMRKGAKFETPQSDEPTAPT